MSYGIDNSNTLTKRLARSYGLMFFAVLAALSVAVFFTAYSFLVQKQKDALVTSAELIADHIVEELREGEALTDRGIMEEQNTNVLLNLYLADETGSIVNQTVNFHLDDSMRQIAAQSPELHFSADRELLLCFEQEVTDEQTHIGTLYAVLNMENEKDFLRLLGILLLSANAVGVFAALAAGFHMSRRMLRPIDSMIEDAESIGSKSMDARLEVPAARDELQRLALTINGMLGRIEAAFDAQGRFVADASHELRTPLAVLQGNADMLCRWGREDERVLSESISSIQRQTEYMNKLVENLLFLARSDGKRQELKKSLFSVNELFEEMLEEQAMIDDAHTYRSECSGAVSLCADRSMIKQLLHAIIDNSVKYTPSGGSITLYAAEEGDEVCIAAADTGIGMDEEHVSHIFERFYRADKARARATGGMGLGLSIAAAIVSAHGGRIWAESEPDNGTTIRAAFPK